MKRFDGQAVWVSGGASGIGEAICELFAEEGAKIACVDVQGGKSRALAERIRSGGGEAVSVECDVAEERAVERSIAETVRAFGGLQCIVNCAGVVDVVELHEYSEEEWDRLMAVNVKSIFFATKHGIAHLRANRLSTMVNIGSISSFVGQGATPAYTASKHAVVGLTRSIALDYAKDGLRCNCICPGITDTPMLRYHLSKAPDPEGALAQRLRRVPIGVALTPRNIATTARFLCSEDSAGVTGTSIVIDGGYLTAAEWETGRDSHGPPAT